MYSLGFLLFITVAWCQSTIVLIPVKKGYFDISPSTTQVTLTSQSNSISDSIDLKDLESLFGDSSEYSKDVTSSSPQKLLNFFSPSDSLQFHSVYNMVSDITSNVCLMSLSSEEEEATDAVDPDAAIKKIGTLANVIMADLASIVDKPQTLLYLYNAIKSENSLFNTAELSSPGNNLKTNGLNSRVKAQVKLGGYPSFDIGVPLHAESHSKETQCIQVSKLAAIHTLNKITSSAIHALEQCTTNGGGGNIQLGNNNGLSPSFQSDMASSISMFSKEVANVASGLGTSDVVTEAISISNNAYQLKSSFSSSMSMTEKALYSLTDANTSGDGGGGSVDGGDINTSSPDYNTMESNAEYNSIEPVVQEESVNQALSLNTYTIEPKTGYSNIQPIVQKQITNEVPLSPPANYEGIAPIQLNSEQHSTISTTSNSGNVYTANTNSISTTSGADTTSNINTNINIENPTTQSILPSIPNIVKNTMMPDNTKTGVPVGVGNGGVGPSAFLFGSNPNPIMQTKPKINILPAPTNRQEEIYANSDLNTKVMMMMNKPVVRNRMPFPNNQERTGYDTMNRNMFY